MFVQVFHAPIKDPELMGRQFKTWVADIKPKTTGYLGSTTAISRDGHCTTLARFRSEDSARVDSALPEQGTWFEETSKAYGGDVTFHDCSEADTFLDGGSNDAGFVQIIEGRTNDQPALRRFMTDPETDAELRRLQPGLIGGTVAWHGDGGFTHAAYFTSEAAARDTEGALGDSALYRRYIALIDGDLTFRDCTTLYID